MDLVNKNKLERLKKKNRGNIQLRKSIEQLVRIIESSQWKTPQELVKTRPDADCVHSSGFYFFNLNVYRTMILIEFEEDGEATVVWTGSHQEYENLFKNNKNTIKKWLRDNEWI